MIEEQSPDCKHCQDYNFRHMPLPQAKDIYVPKGPHARSTIDYAHT